MDKDIENYIETKYRELSSNINIEYKCFYQFFEYDKLIKIFSTLHSRLTSSYKLMNSRLPTNELPAHFWAEDSRNLIHTINTLTGLQRVLQDSKYAFKLDHYYADIIEKSQSFLSESSGSEIPPHMEQVTLYYTIPIFIPVNSINITSGTIRQNEELKLIGEGSYAQVFKYKDSFYNKRFVVKRAKKELNFKELERFKREYEQMKILHSPYIVEVYRYNDDKNEYIMEYMDNSLDEYIRKNNSTLMAPLRNSIVHQVLRAFQYIHSKGILHRDVSPKNVLLKLYDDIVVVKIADFGLVKIPNSQLTDAATNPKGYFNDPALAVEGFDSYGILHETYALTRLIFFIMEGKTNTSNISNTKLKAFVEKGLASDKTKRYQSVDELFEKFKEI